MARALPLDPDVRRAQLLQAARAVFALRGYHAASIADILQVAGVARGTFYNYFESKRDVFQAVLTELIADVTAAVAPIDVTRPIAPQVEDDVRRVIAVLVGMGGGVRILFTDAAAVDEDSADALRAFHAAAKERLARALRVGQALEIVREGDADLMALLLIGMLREPVWQGWLAGEPPDGDALVSALVGVITGGVVRVA